MGLVIFTPETARQTLPLVRQIIGDIVKLHLELDGLKDKVRKESRRFSRFRLEGLEASRQHSQGIQGERQRIGRRLGELRGELTRLGCSLLDGPRGVVGYPAFVNDELVHLCWRYGDLDITHFVKGRDHHQRLALPGVPTSETDSRC